MHSPKRPKTRVAKGNLVRFFLFVLFLCAGLASPAFAQTERFALQTNLDHVWTMTAAGLVFFMQGGFLLLEAGSVRSKNSINVAQKNLMDFILSTMCFAFIGFALMFGTSINGWVGFSREMALFEMGGGEWSTTFFVFQLVFCGTAATIVSGAVAERTSMAAYTLIVILIGTLIYPIAGHWAWGGLLTGDEKPWLAAMGFMDFAGSTVVHSVGAWVALAACLLIGPRYRRYTPEGKPVTLHGHSQVLSTFGAIIIFVGWIGFNGGSTLAGSGAFATIIGNTFLSAAGGGLAMMILGYMRSGIQRPENLINGSLSGLVGITAGCDVMSGPAAVLVGVTSAFVYDRSRRFLTGRFKIDDPVGAISVHGAAGAWGTIAIALFAPSQTLLAGGRLAQIGVQSLGVVAFFLWSFGIAFLVLKLAARVLPSPDGPGRGLRVPEADEVIGLNVSEHAAPLGISGLVDGMQAVLENPEADFKPIEVEYGEEGYEASVLFNRIAARMREDHARKQDEMQKSVDLLDAMGALVQGIEAGNLRNRLEGVADGPFAGLPEKMNSMVGSFEGLVREISQSTDLVWSTAQDLLMQSEDLRSQTSAQSNQLHRLSEEVSNLRQETQKTGQQIKSAVGSVKDLRDTVVQGASAFQVAADSMVSAAKATDRISAAMEQIDSIAFETRLLSLNASVEAARAKGEGMAGFAVIAEEVRKLADATKDTAGNIRLVVNEVRADSNDAAARAQETQTLFMKVRDGMNDTAETMQEVGAAQDRADNAMQMVAGELDAMQSQVGEVVSQAEKTGQSAGRLEESARESEEIVARFQLAPVSKAA